MIEDYEKLLKCYEASCRVTTQKALGSCTIIYSKNKETLALTNYHVIENCIQNKDVWDNILQKDIKKQFTKSVEVLYPDLDTDRVEGYSTVKADIIIHDKEQDMALLRFRNEKDDYPFVKLYDRKKVKKVPILSELACIGAALGHEPITTFGYLNGVDNEIDNYEYWLSSAPSIFGNSGGGIFVHTENDWFFLGIPSRISVTGGWGGQAVTHMGFFIPLFRIYDWLEENCYQYIYDDIMTKEQCDDLREGKQEEGIIKQLIKKKL